MVKSKQPNTRPSVKDLEEKKGTEDLVLYVITRTFITSEDLKDPSIVVEGITTNFERATAQAKEIREFFQEASRDETCGDENFEIKTISNRKWVVSSENYSNYEFVIEIHEVPSHKYF